MSNLIQIDEEVFSTLKDHLEQERRSTAALSEEVTRLRTAAQDFTDLADSKLRYLIRITSHPENLAVTRRNLLEMIHELACLQVSVDNYIDVVLVRDNLPF